MEGKKALMAMGFVQSRFKDVYSKTDLIDVSDNRIQVKAEYLLENFDSDELNFKIRNCDDVPIEVSLKSEVANEYIVLDDVQVMGVAVFEELEPYVTMGVIKELKSKYEESRKDVS